MRIPFAYRLEIAALGGDDIVNGAVILPGVKVLVPRAAVVEHLNFHPGIRGVALRGRADADAVVGVGSQLELEAKNKVAVLFFGVKIAAVVNGAVDGAILDGVALAELVQLAVPQSQLP